MSTSFSKTHLLLMCAALVGVALGIALPALAQEPIVPKECRWDAIRAKASDCTLCHIAIMTVNFTKFLMKFIALPITALLVAAGGTMLLISGPSEPLRTQGKRILTATLIGLIIVFLAWLMVDTLIKLLTGSLNFGGPPGELIKAWGPWNEVRIPAGGCPL